MQGSNNGDESPHCTEVVNLGSDNGSRGEHRLTGLKQMTLVLVALRVSYADITTRPAIERAIWRTTQLDIFSVSWPVASFWAAEASRGWSGDGVDDMGVS